MRLAEPGHRHRRDVWYYCPAVGCVRSFPPTAWGLSAWARHLKKAHGLPTDAWREAGLLPRPPRSRGRNV